MLSAARYALPIIAAFSLAMTARVAAEIPPDSPVADALRRAERAVEEIVAIPDERRTFENTMMAIDDLFATLEADTNMTQFLAYVSTDADERAAGQLAEEHVNNFLIDLGTREDLYRAVKAYAATNPDLGGARELFLEETLRDYRRAGMELEPEQRERLNELRKEATRLGIEFERNIREDETTVAFTAEELAGVPEDALANMDRSVGLYLAGMDYPTLDAILNYADNETTRQKYWTAYKRKGGRKNVALLERIIALRAQAADLLGYEHPADYEIEVKMAGDADAVMDFYEKLRPLVREKAEKDYAELVAAKRAHTGDPGAKLYPWDFSYYEKRLLKSKYAVDSQEVQEYFPLERVIDGLFSITQSLYGLEYRDVTAQAGSKNRPIWHPDVKLYEVIDTRSGRMIGEFYLDLHPRDHKYGHAAQWGMRQHKVWADGREQTPIAALVCNFTKPTADKPSLLTHQEVETFFHEFGHCLHTILSTAELYTMAGTNVARDFVEAPSQMFENWVWDADVLATFTRHYETGAPLPADLIDRMVQARNLGSGMLAEHQFYYGLVDMAFHMDPAGDPDTTAIAEKLFEEVELYPAIPETYYHAGFGHFVGYEAGYYGYMWSRVYAEDMFQRFKELGMLDPEAGRYYREKILARGGTLDEMEMVEDYLGRAPRMDAFLRYLGLEE